MAKSKGRLLGIRDCLYCKNKVEIYHKHRLTQENMFCSPECHRKFALENQDLNTSCVLCGKLFHLKPYQKNRTKTHCCSLRCSYEYKQQTMLGENNHQFGLKGYLNPTWKTDKKISHYGYRLIRCLNHPFRNSDDFVFEHRLIAEKYLLNKENSVEIDGESYLKKEYVVHHKDFNKLNNSIDNLQVMTKEDHIILHNKLRDFPRDELGRFVSTGTQ